MKNLKHEMRTLWLFAGRNAKIFLRDKALVFFSLLAPIIVLMLYILFLSDIQLMAVQAYIPEGAAVDEKLLRSFVDGWMIAGVLGVSCITVSLGANSVAVQDKTKGIYSDNLASPVRPWVFAAGYFIYNFLVTTVITLEVLAISLGYTAISGGWYIRFGDVAAIIGIIIYSSLAATLFTSFICRFIKTESALSAFTGILSSVIGFLIGAYMPMSIMPKGVQYLSACIPGSHSAGLFRNFMMRGALTELSYVMPEQAVAGLEQSFAMKINFFGTDVHIEFMAAFLAISIIIFAVLNIIKERTNKKG